MHYSRVLLCLALAGAEARPGSPRWHFDKQSRPGWHGPNVPTPAQPMPTWPHHGPPYPYSPPATAPRSYPSASGSISGTAPVTGTGSAGPTGTGGTAPAATGPCATVSRLVASFSATNTNPSALPTVPAGVAYECINEVPFNSSAAVELMDSIRPYIDWQTTVSWLKDPPAEYAEKVQPAYDFWAEFERIYDEAAAGSYASEYAFGFELYRAFQRTHDGHFVFYPDSVTAIFSYGRTEGLVSVSPDGEAVPEIYAYSDLTATGVGNATFTPSAITQIDGQDAVDFLLTLSQYGSLQDRDALWNNQFVELAQLSLGASGGGLGGFAGGGRGRWVYPGETTELTFANGTTKTLYNFARVLAPSFDGITTGEDIYQTYFIPPPGEPMEIEEIVTVAPTTSSAVAESSSSSTSSSSTSTFSAPGYPTPVIRELNGLNAGYYLEGEGYEDVAVLTVYSFISALEDEIPFQDTNDAFIKQAKADGKTKLIIDVQANGGGTILQGYDLFLQLFPNIVPYGGQRYRAHEAFYHIGHEVSWFSGQYPRSLDIANETVLNIISDALNYRTDLDVNLEPFTSWDDKFGPDTIGPGPDNFTSLFRWNLTDVLTPLNSGGIYLSGYSPRDNITESPFAPENVVVVTDGYCASTCTIFSELMRQQAGVKYVMLGGRPTTDVVQAVGGVKGTNSQDWSYLLAAVSYPFLIAHYHDFDYYAGTALGNYSDLPLYRGTAYVVNARDGYRQGDETDTPLQFVYEPADCRIYYTPAMTVDIRAMWKSVADSAFNGIDRCVGSTGTLAKRDAYTKRSFSAMTPHMVGRDVDLSVHRAVLSGLSTAGGMNADGDGLMLL